MKAYSSIDLLNKENGMFQSKNFFVYWIESWIDRKTTEAEISITVPYTIYLRTRMICDYIRSVYDTPMNTNHFINILYMDFIHRNMKRHNPSKMYEELSKYEYKSLELQINDYSSNKTYTYKQENQSKISIDFSISKINIKRGEMFLAELDEITSKFITVEETLSRLWINFIQGFSDGNNEKAIDKILKLAAKNF